LWPAIVLLIVSSGVDVAWGPAAGASMIHHSERLRQALQAMVREELPQLVSEDGTLSPTPPDPATFVDFLIKVLSKNDDYVGWTMLEDFVDEEGPEPDRIFLAALAAPSPNIRAVAVRRFASHWNEESLPLLEGLWDGGVPDWARADLMTALAFHGSRSHLDDTIAWTYDPDAALRLTAIKALEFLPEERVQARLLELASSRDRHERSVALKALSSYTDSDEAFEAILAASRSDDALEFTAIRLLECFHRPERDARLLEYITGPRDVSLRVLTADGLRSSDDPRATDALLDLLASPMVQVEEWRVEGVLAQLRERGDAGAIPRLLSMADSDERHKPDYEELALYLQGEGGHSEDTWTTACSDFYEPDPEGPEEWHVVAPRERTSVRCFDDPAVAGTSWPDARIPNGARVTIRSRFDRAGETWTMLDQATRTGCWVPMRDLERGPGSGETPIDPTRVELDLPGEALETRAARHLISMGAIEPFDRDVGVVGVVLHPRSGGPTLSDLLAALRDGMSAPAAERLEAFIDDLEPQDFEGQPLDAEPDAIDSPGQQDEAVTSEN
jgi:hypothetical protein